MTSTRQLPDQTNLMEELAQRCERASGPDRELDGAIWAAIQGVELLIFEAPPSSGEVLSYRGELRYPSMPGVARFTESLDAAMRLLPPNRSVIQYWIVGKKPSVSIQGIDFNEGDVHTNANTKELALCAASIRAASLRARKGLE